MYTYFSNICHNVTPSYPQVRARTMRPRDTSSRASQRLDMAIFIGQNDGNNDGNNDGKRMMQQEIWGYPKPRWMIFNT